MTPREAEITKFHAIKTWAEYSEYMSGRPATEPIIEAGGVVDQRIIWFPTLLEIDEKKKELTRTNGPREGKGSPAASDP